MASKANKSATEQITDPGFLGELWQQIRLVYYLIRDSEVPLYLKILPFVGILYALFPLDIVTDVIPVIGQLDDLTILIIGAKVFIEMAPAHVVSKYMAQMRGGPKITVLDGEASDVNAEPLYIEGQVVDDDAEALKASERKGRS